MIVPVRQRYYRKVIKISGEDSPSVIKGLQQERLGLPITDEEVIPGVLTYGLYKKRRATWDRIRQCIGIDGDFYEGAEVLMYPPDWLNTAERIAKALAPNRKGTTLGVDSAMGNDNTAWAVCDTKGLIYLYSVQTPDTTEVVTQTLMLMHRYSIKAKNVLFDHGGGGLQHADILRKRGHNVRVIAFGASATNDKRRGMTPFTMRVEGDERAYAYKNRRCEMYGELRRTLDPQENPEGFGLPEEYTELRRQLAPLPLLYDGEGRLWMPPKHKKDADDTTKTITEMIGCSPDEADALVLAHFGLVSRGGAFAVGAI